MTLLAGQVASYCRDIHAENVAAGWWTDLATGKRKDRNVGELLILVISELAEGADGHELRLNDDKLPHRVMLEVELADAAIRIFDIAGAHQLDMEGALLEPAVSSFQAVKLFEDTTAESLFRIARQVIMAMEGHRKNKACVLAPGRKAFEVRLALALRSIWEMADAYGYDIEAAIAEKRSFNRVREDHKIATRMAVGGKRY